MAVCLFLSTPFMAEAAYYWCKGTNMTDSQAAATKIRMGVVVSVIAYFLEFLGIWITLGQIYSYVSCDYNDYNYNPVLCD